MEKNAHKYSVVIVTPARSIGCASQAIDTYAEQLSANGHSVYTFFLDTSTFEAITQYLEKHDVHVVLTNSIYYGSGASYSRTIEFLRCCREHNIRVVDIAHFGKLDTTVDSLLSKRLFVSKTLLLKYTLQASKLGLDLNKYDYLYNPITIAPKPIERDQSNDSFVVGRIGRGDINKWDDSIIRIAPLLVNRIPNFKIIIQSMPQELVAKIPSGLRTYVTVLPESTDRAVVLRTIASCSVLVQTSKIGESFGCAIAEGMALGKPIITNSTDFSAPVLFDRDNAQTELVEDGINGFVETTPEGMAGRIVELYENPSLYKTISSANRIQARMLFDKKTLTRRLEKFLFSNADSTSPLPLSFEEYRRKVKQEPWGTLLKLNFDYLVRRFRRKLKHLGLSECC